METKDQLIQSIKDWVKIDNEMRTLQSEISKRKKEKKKISEKLILGLHYPNNLLYYGFLRKV